MTATVLTLASTYDDAMALLLEARAYAAHRQRTRDVGVLPTHSVRAGFETLRITTRLTQAMAWLLGQRAVAAGEIDMATAASEFGLAAHDLCLDESALTDAGLPVTLRALSARSLSLYARVDRLDRQVRRRLRTIGSQSPI